MMACNPAVDGLIIGDFYYLEMAFAQLLTRSLSDLNLISLLRNVNDLKSLITSVV